jgi:predicted component of viral defense system (DUF524 family)
MPKQHLETALKVSVERENRPGTPSNDHDNYLLANLQLLLEDVEKGSYSRQDFEQYWQALQLDVDQFLQKS